MTLFCLLCVTVKGYSQTQNNKDNTKDSVSQALDVWVTRIEIVVVPAAEAMPADKFSFAPVNGAFSGVRTFAEQIKHFSATQYQLAAAILGEEMPHGEKNETAPDYIKTKVQIIEYLKGSFAYLHKAVSTINKENMTNPITTPFKGNRLGFVVDALSHTYNHYGQMVEYLRMNGIVPPESRNGN